MAYLIKASDSITALNNLLSYVLEEGDVIGDRIEVLNTVVSISPEEELQTTEKFMSVYKEIVGTEFWDRAEQLYCSSEPLSWKVSYRGRLIGMNTESEANQIQNIIQRLTKTPGANTLSFSFYRPNDHIRARAIPASMPCPIAGDFKYRQGQLHLNVFFRTHDVYRLGFPDLYFMRALQREILREVQDIGTGHFEEANLGELNLFFSRVFILKRYRSGAEQLREAIGKFQRNYMRKK